MEENTEVVSIKKRLPLHWEILIVALIVFVLHYVASVYFLYWTLPWFDILMHFLGGFLIALLSVYGLSKVGWFKVNNPNSFMSIAAVLALTLIVGLSWELWELFVGFSDQLSDKWDTVADIIMDLLGALAAYVYNRKTI